jgi:hypothetical protein
LTPARFRFLALVCLALACLVLACPASPAAAADDWPKLLFKTTSHDFGTVARGAVAEYRFQMENPFVEDVNIYRIETSCGCTKTAVTKQRLKTYETGELVATLDTRRYLGQKDATITVKFDKPFLAEFRLKVTSYIRSDVVFEPGEVQFGSVPQGQSVKKRVSVSYAGRRTWQVVRVGSDSPFLDIEMAEVSRSVDPRTNVGKVLYDLSVALKEAAPTGYFKDFVVLQTDDLNPQTARIPLTVEALVVPSLIVNPSVVMFGAVSAGETVSKNLVVRGQKPFRVVEVEGPDARFRANVPQTARRFQSDNSTFYVAVIALEFRSGDAAGRIAGKVRIKTDLPGTRPLEVSLDGQVTGKSLDKIERPSSGAAEEKETER